MLKGVSPSTKDGVIMPEVTQEEIECGRFPDSPIPLDRTPVSDDQHK